jgi:hypothetical protein
MGIDISVTIPSHTVASYLEYINSRTREVWERYPWPEWTLIEQREYRATYAAGTAYVTGDEVFYVDAYYRAIGSTTGNLPTDVTYWEAATDLVQNIELAQAGETEISEMVAVWGSDPRVNRSAREYGFSLVADGVLVPLGPAQPWIEFCKVAPVFAVADLDSLVFPKVIAEPVKLLAAAEAQREDGQFEKAMALEAAGMALVDQELDKIEMKQGQLRRWGKAEG